MPTDILAIAARLGIHPPTYDQAARPDLWQCWQDRVELAAAQWERGTDPRVMIREAEIYGGHPPPDPTTPIPGRWPDRLDAFFRNLPLILLEASETEGSA